MATLYSPADVGFDKRLVAIDRCQVGLLRELANQHGARLILKGGMAMRAAFGSMRLTKDIDFDRDETISQESLKKTLEKSLARAAVLSGIRSPLAEITKGNSMITVRARLQGQLVDGQDVRFEVEVSGRPAPIAYRRSEVVVPPPAYSMAPFSVVTYRNEALAAMKVAAALSDQRTAPRDLYDLRDLIRADADPTELLSKQARKTLEHFAANSLDKLEMLTYSLAQNELLAYLPPAQREELTDDAWIETMIMVGEKIRSWCAAALALQARP